MKIQNRAKICLCISIVIMLVAVVMSLTGHGINYGIDFAGGLNLQYDMGSTYDKADVEEALKAQGIEEFVVSTVGSEGTAVQIRVPTLSDEDEVQNLQNGLETTLLEKYPNMDTDNATASYVGPVAGATLVRNAIFSVLIAGNRARIPAARAAFPRIPLFPFWNCWTAAGHGSSSAKAKAMCRLNICRP